MQNLGLSPTSSHECEEKKERDTDDDDSVFFLVRFVFFLLSFGVSYRSLRCHFSQLLTKSSLQKTKLTSLRFHSLVLVLTCSRSERFFPITFCSRAPPWRSLFVFLGRPRASTSRGFYKSPLGRLVRGALLARMDASSRAAPLALPRNFVSAQRRGWGDLVLMLPDPRGTAEAPRDLQTSAPFSTPDARHPSPSSATRFWEKSRKGFLAPEIPAESGDFFSGETFFCGKGFFPPSLLKNSS